MKPGIAVLGAGRMGSALATAFLNQGYETHVWNRTRSKLVPLAALGARIAPVAAGGGRRRRGRRREPERLRHDRCACLRSDGLARGLRGKLLVQLTSGSPRQAQGTGCVGQRTRHSVPGWRHHGDAKPHRRARVHDSLFGAGRAVRGSARPSSLTLGGNSLHVGSDVGHASALDSALLIVMWGALFGALQGVAICKAENLRLDAYLGYLRPVLPQVDGWVMDVVKRIEEGRLAGDEATLATLDSHYGAFRHLLELCKERGIGHADARCPGRGLPGGHQGWTRSR